MVMILLLYKLLLIKFLIPLRNKINKAFNNLFNSDDLTSNLDLIDTPKYKLKLVDTQVLPL